MRTFILSFLSILFCFPLQHLRAQAILVNKGVTIALSPGALLKVQNSGISNEDSIINHGRIDVDNTIYNRNGSLFYTDDATIIGDSLRNNGYFAAEDSVLVANGVINHDTLYNATANGLFILGTGEFRNTINGVVINTDTAGMETQGTFSSDWLNRGQLFNANHALLDVQTNLINDPNAILLNDGATIQANIINNADTLSNVNGGYISTTVRFENLSNGTFINDASNDTLLSNGDINNDGLFLNDGSAFALTGINNNAGGEIGNNGSMVTDGDLSNDAYLQNDGQVLVNGLSNTTDTLINNGFFNLQDNFTNSILGYVLNTDTMVFAQDFTNNGRYDHNTGVLGYIGTGPGARTLDLRGDSVYNLFLDGDGLVSLPAIGIDTLRILNNLSLQDAYLISQGLVLVDSGATIIGGNSNSYVKGGLMRRDSGMLLYPIGDPGLDNFYRPIRIDSLQLTSAGRASTILFDVNKSPGTLIYDANTLGSVSNTRVWEGTLIAGEFSPTDVTVGFGGDGVHGDGVTDLNRVVVAQAPSLAGDFVSLGNDSTTGVTSTGNPLAPTGSVTSRWTASSNVIALGAADNVLVSAHAFLEGASDAAGTTMDTLPKTQLSNFEYGGAAPINMYEGYSVPDSAVDVVRIILRSGAAFPGTDEALAPAWLLKDGSMVDFYTGTKPYISVHGGVNNSTPYWVKVEHRNSLSMVNNSSATYGNYDPSPVDLTDPANIYSVGYKLKGTTAVMIGGNANNSNQAIDALDYIRVGIENVSMTPGYILENVVIDGAGVVNALDFNLTSENNDIGYFSTAD